MSIGSVGTVGGGRLSDGFFLEAFEYLVRTEGGYVDNPVDSGGCTKYGITLKSLRDFHHNETLTKQDIFNLTLSQAQDFYYQSFWRPLGLDKCISSDVCRVLLDQSVNRGMGPVRAQLSSLLDAKLSPSFPTHIEILNFYESEKDKVPRLIQSFLTNFLVMSLKAYVEIVIRSPKDVVFLRGWVARVTNLMLLSCNN